MRLAITGSLRRNIFFIKIAGHTLAKGGKFVAGDNIDRFVETDRQPHPARRPLPGHMPTCRRICSDNGFTVANAGGRQGPYPQGRDL